MTPDRELRVCTVVIDRLPWVQVGYWRRKGPLFVATGGHAVIDGRHLDGLITSLEDARKTVMTLGGRKTW